MDKDRMMVLKAVKFKHSTGITIYSDKTGFDGTDMAAVVDVLVFSTHKKGETEIRLGVNASYDNEKYTREGAVLTILRETILTLAHDLKVDLSPRLQVESDDS